MLFGGIQAFSEVTAVDLTGEERTCESVVDMPSQFDRGLVATFLNKEVVVCGGFNSDLGTKNCFASSRQVHYLLDIL